MVGERNKQMKRKSIAIVVLLSLIAIGLANEVVHMYSPDIDDIDYDIELPDKPEDFDLITREMQSHYLDLCLLNEEYFLQPEFYSSSWSRGKHYYVDHDYGRWGVHGYGVYPGILVIEFQDTTKGNWISTCTFFHAGWNVETWQGIKLVAEDNEYFDVNVKPNEFLIGRTFPVFECGEEDSWAKKLKVNVSIKKKPPQGTYNIGVNTMAPSETNAQKWFWYVMKQNITTKGDLEMIENCEKQLETSTKCTEWISSSRKNKYIEGSIFQMPPRLNIKVIVK
jgi:hypothetical protein